MTDLRPNVTASDRGVVHRRHPESSRLQPWPACRRGYEFRAYAWLLVSQPVTCKRCLAIKGMDHD
jgi:hypothetical protein